MDIRLEGWEWSELYLREWLIFFAVGEKVFIEDLKIELNGDIVIRLKV